jgi:hypothetical protein
MNEKTSQILLDTFILSLLNGNIEKAEEIIDNYFNKIIPSNTYNFIPIYKTEILL